MYLKQKRCKQRNNEISDLSNTRTRFIKKKGNARDFKILKFSIKASVRLARMLLEIRKASFRVWLHSRASRLPSSRADFSMFICKLKRLNQSQCFVHTSAHWQIIHSNLPQIAFVINNEQPSECNTFNKQVKYRLHTFS